MTEHKMDYIIVGGNATWRCPICQREISVSVSQGITIVNRGDQSVDHTTTVSPPGLDLSAGAEVGEPIPAAFAEWEAEHD